jgi:hypothetical protein
MEALVIGFGAGAAVVVALMVGLHLRPSVAGEAAPVPIGGAVIVATVVAVLAWRADEVSALVGPVAMGGLLAGLALTWGLGLSGRFRGWPTTLRLLALLPGAVLSVAALSRGSIGWIPITALVAAVTALAVEAVEARHGPSGITLPMAAVSAVGVLVVVPDTEVAAPMAGVVAAVALSGWPLRRVWLGPGGAAAVMVMSAAVTLNGGAVRTSALIGGLAAPGLLVTLAAGSRGGPDQTPEARLPLLLAVQCLIVFGLTRIAGLEASSLRSAAWAVAFLGLGWVAGGFITGDRGGGRRR